jgi:glucokinase
MPHPFFAGVDIGASNVRVVIGADGSVEARLTPFTVGPPERVRTIGRAIDDMVRGVDTASVGAIGGDARQRRPRAELVASPAGTAGQANVPRSSAARLCGRERRQRGGRNSTGRGGGHVGLRLVALGTGIDGALAWGRLHRGAHFLGGEAAFFPMTREQLAAGDWQHNLEAIAGGRALDATAREVIGARANAPQLFEAAERGDVRAQTAVRRAQEYLAMAVADMVALLDPQAIVFGGGVAMAQGEAFLGPVRDMVHRCVPVKTPIVLSKLGTDAQILGAVKLAIDASK